MTDIKHWRGRSLADFEYLKVAGGRNSGIFVGMA
jgi:hypothetical protein